MRYESTVLYTIAFVTLLAKLFLFIGNAAVLAVLLEGSVADPCDEWLQDAVLV